MFHTTISQGKNIHIQRSNYLLRNNKKDVNTQHLGFIADHAYLRWIVELQSLPVLGCTQNIYRKEIAFADYGGRQNSNDVGQVCGWENQTWSHFLAKLTWVRYTV